jgi:hypothetical protein
MGTAVFWGMLVATMFGIFLIPGNYAFIQGWGYKKGAKTAPPLVEAPSGEAH